MFGLVCSSFVTISAGTHKRTPFNPLGDESVGMVARGNKLAAVIFGLKVLYHLFFGPLVSDGKLVYDICSIRLIIIVKCMFSLLFTLSCHAVVSMMNVVAKDNVTANGGFGYERFLDT